MEMILYLMRKMLQVPGVERPSSMSLSSICKKRQESTLILQQMLMMALPLEA